MSEENVELVRGIYDAVDRRDDVSPYEAYAEDIVWDMSQVPYGHLLTRPVFHGHEGVRQFWREMVAGFGVWDLEVEEIVDAGDRVLAVVRDRAVGRASGVPVQSGHVAVWTLSGGKAIRLQTFEPDDRKRALEAAGLSG
jgi:ketosteroid isomerase-like protein